MPLDFERQSGALRQVEAAYGDVARILRRWYVDLRLDTGTIAGLLRERGIEVDRVTITRWLHRAGVPVRRAGRPRTIERVA